MKRKIREKIARLGYLNRIIGDNQTHELGAERQSIVNFLLALRVIKLDKQNKKLFMFVGNDAEINKEIYLENYNQ